MVFAFVVLLVCGLLKWHNIGAALVCVSNDPVCGNDGKTYPNICRLSLAKVNNRDLLPLHEGYCHIVHESKSNHKSYARSGKKYKTLKKQNANLEDHGYLCPAIYSPVCGSDGVTYGNQCNALSQTLYEPKFHIKHHGECEFSSNENDKFKSKDKKGEKHEPESIDMGFMCHAIYNPVCGSDDVTYGNECVALTETLRDPTFHIKHKGECEGHINEFNDEIGKLKIKNKNGKKLNTEYSEREHICPAIYSPVCGSDGVTYGNECNALFESLRDPAFYVKYNGECEGEFTNKISKMKFKKLKGKSLIPENLAIGYACPAIYSPICGSDGLTYGNECSALYKKLRDPQFIVKHHGECEGDLQFNNEFDDMPPFKNEKGKKHHDDGHLCPAMYRPVCGSDGVTYGNKCNALYETLSNPKFYVKHDGECEGHINSFGGEITKMKWKSTKKYDIEPPHICYNSYSPVCGSDGITYSNQCEALYARLYNPKFRIKRKGKCKISDGLHF